MTQRILCENEARIRSLHNGFITGGAGTGKTHVIQQILKDDPGWGFPTATTGIAAVTLSERLGQSVPTLCAALQCATIHDFRKQFENGLLRDILSNFLIHKRIIVDECSMLHREVFDILYQSCQSIHLGLILIGDFCQLPPIVKEEDGLEPPKWCFQSEFWNEFTDDGRAIIRMTKNHRQGDPDFIQALNLLRRGDGAEASRLLYGRGSQFTATTQDLFEGMTLVYCNETQRKINENMLGASTGKRWKFERKLWGEPLRPEWLEIPPSVDLTVGSRAMVLSNRYDKGQLVQANGMCGVVTDLDLDFVVIERDHQRGSITVSRKKEDNSEWIQYFDEFGDIKYEKIPATAGVDYLPVRPAWASTVHKIQGVTLNGKLQIALDDPGMGNDAIMYVAASRSRRAEDLCFAGKLPIQKLCNIDPAVRQWI
jgi:hypothetical protein